MLFRLDFRLPAQARQVSEGLSGAFSGQPCWEPDLSVVELSRPFRRRWPLVRRQALSLEACRLELQESHRHLVDEVDQRLPRPSLEQEVLLRLWEHLIGALALARRRALEDQLSERCLARLALVCRELARCLLALELCPVGLALACLELALCRAPVLASECPWALQPDLLFCLERRGL